MFVVAEGYSFCTARGVIKPGAEIKESDFAKEETFQKKVDAGHIVEVKSKEQSAAGVETKTAAAAKKAADKAAEQAKKEELARNVEIAEAAVPAAGGALIAAKNVFAEKEKLPADNAERIAAALELEKAEAALKEAEAKLSDAKKAAKEA